ncbi:hypothetical protein MKZ38_005619 [Zalerion maritima]|uniref:Telomere repeat-binding factor dimerisation domain-containing protein n=1 Tax=Zalerion maritima TaxID=339359 RepID=A0AAD5WQW2_9PEZI|nr:hypothetical protein MKZ38_005619 [Zalerion maritima]
MEDTSRPATWNQPATNSPRMASLSNIYGPNRYSLGSPSQLQMGHPSTPNTCPQFIPTTTLSQPTPSQSHGGQHLKRTRSSSVGGDLPGLPVKRIKCESSSGPELRYSVPEASLTSQAQVASPTQVPVAQIGAFSPNVHHEAQTGDIQESFPGCFPPSHLPSPVIASIESNPSQPVASPRSSAFDHELALDLIGAMNGDRQPTPTKSSPEATSILRQDNTQGREQTWELDHDPIPELVFTSLHNNTDIMLDEVKKFANGSNQVLPWQRSSSFLALCRLVHQTREAVGKGTRYLSPHQCDLASAEVIEDVNTALFCASVFQPTLSVKVLEELYNNFLSVFAHDDERPLTLNIGQLLLDLGTELYLSKIEAAQPVEPHQPVYPNKPLLDQFLGDGFEMILRTRRLGHDLLSAEQAVLLVADTRLKKLMEIVPLKNHKMRFPFMDFLRRLAKQVQQRDEPTHSSTRSTPAKPNPVQQVPSAPSRIASSQSSGTIGSPQSPLEPTYSNGTPGIPLQAQPAHAARNGQVPVETTPGCQAPSQFTPSSVNSHIKQPMMTLPATPTVITPVTAPVHNGNQHPANSQQSQQVPYYANIPGADAPTQSPQGKKMLVQMYNELRNAVAKTNGTHRETNTKQGSRKPWSKDEEEALLIGIESVDGPYWSAILGMFGHNGSISSALAERSQVQLKDKARNLKLFFLKNSDAPLPHCLALVTGNIKTRAPSRHAKMQAAQVKRGHEAQNGYAPTQAPAPTQTSPPSPPVMPQFRAPQDTVPGPVTGALPPFSPRPNDEAPALESQISIPDNMPSAPVTPTQASALAPEVTMGSPTTGPVNNSKQVPRAVEKLFESFETGYRSTTREFAFKPMRRATNSPVPVVQQQQQQQQQQQNQQEVGGGVHHNHHYQANGGASSLPATPVTAAVLVFPPLPSPQVPQAAQQPQQQQQQQQQQYAQLAPLQQPQAQPQQQQYAPPLQGQPQAHDAQIPPAAATVSAPQEQGCARGELQTTAVAGTEVESDNDDELERQLLAMLA